MSAFVQPALALAQRAASTLPGHFADLARRAPAPDILKLETSGHTQAGVGAGQYISDALCDASLLAAHPRLVFRCTNGRIFRLLPNRGSISVEQAGATADGASDDRDAIQAAIDYAEAVGAREVCFEAPLYRIHCPIRTSPVGETRALDGHPIIVSRSIALRGAASVPTVLDFRGPNGGDPVGEYQLVATTAADPTPAIWRGGGIFVNGDPTDPGSDNRRIARLELSRLELRGNRTRSGVSSWPADPVSGDGWDITDKAFWMQDCYAGDIICQDVAMTGWRGEIFYLGGAVDSLDSLRLERCTFVTSDGTAFNPGVTAKLIAQDCEFGDAFQGQEDTGKARARYRDCLWRDCDIVGLGSGPTTSSLYNFAYPTRDESGDLPLTEFSGCLFRNAGTIYIASWLAGEIRTIDTQVQVNAALSKAPRDVDLRIEAWLDQANDIPPLTIYGPAALDEQVGGAPAGTYRGPPSNMRFAVRHYRSELAMREGRSWSAVTWSGYIDKSCRIECEGEHGNARVPHAQSAPLSMPYVGFEKAVATTAYVPRGAFALPAFTASGEFVPVGPSLALQVANEEQIDLAPLGEPAGGEQFGFAQGQKLTLHKLLDTGSIRFVKGIAPYHFEMTETRVLDNAHDWIEFTYNADLTRWDESGFFSSA